MSFEEIIIANGLCCDSNEAVEPAFSRRFSFNCRGHELIAEICFNENQVLLHKNRVRIARYDCKGEVLYISPNQEAIDFFTEPLTHQPVKFDFLKDIEITPTVNDETLKMFDYRVIRSNDGIRFFYEGQGSK